VPVAARLPTGGVMLLLRPEGIPDVVNVPTGTLMNCSSLRVGAKPVIVTGADNIPALDTTLGANALNVRSPLGGVTR